MSDALQNKELVSVVIPIYNQADHIGMVIQEYQTAFLKIQNPFELICVVNACRDNSLKICRDLEKKYSSMRVIESAKGGWGNAVKLGLSEAKGSLLCFTNSARTSAQDLALLLLYALIYPNVVIKANRKIREGLVRRVGSLIYNLECRALFDISNWDINGTPKIFPRSFGKLLNLTQGGDLLDAEFNLICKLEEYPVLEVPIFSARRHGGKSTTNFYSALSMYWGAYQLGKKYMKGRR